MGNIKISYKGNLRTRAIHIASGHKITTDAQIDNNGKGEKFLIKQIETRSSSELAAIPAGYNLIKSFVTAMAANNEEALMNLTCLGLTKEQLVEETV